MKLHYKNSQITEESLQDGFSELQPYIETLKKIFDEKGYEKPEGSINLPFDEEILSSVMEMKRSLVTENLKYVVHIGIGGAGLGPQAIYDALFGHFDLLEPERFPKAIFLDTNGPEFSEKLTTLLAQIKNPEEIVISIASKSGGTLETKTNFELVKKLTHLKERIVVISTEGSPLWLESEEEGVSLLIHPTVGGRFSVLTPVGLFPLACLGVDIERLLRGAQTMQTAGLSPQIEDNLPAMSAILAFESFQKGKTINDTFVFYPELESLGKWYRQLLGESIGKDGKGITPTVTVGSIDLHSVWQLYVGGPKDKFLNLVWADSKGDKQAIKNMEAIDGAVKATAQEKGVPTLELELLDKKEEGLGEFMQFKMIEMMFLGNLFDVNAFDQPDVEGYKIKTKELLSSN